MVKEFTDNQKQNIRDALSHYSGVSLIEHRGVSKPNGDSMVIRSESEQMTGYVDYKIWKQQRGREVIFGVEGHGTYHEFENFVDKIESLVADIKNVIIYE